MHHVTVASKVLSTSLLTVMVVLCVCLCVQDPELKVENDEGAKAGKIHFIGLAHSHATGKGMHIGSIDIPFFVCVCLYDRAHDVNGWSYTGLDHYLCCFISTSTFFFHLISSIRRCIFTNLYCCALVCLQVLKSINMP